uniref:Uncharacterized protein LOC102802238 n=1 Tax=Saccoglossus kowalevskii TaxID=10224 RepID=A0ABM0MIT9_SACKO|nr:PREDICTED: uncharacterized protein LOC102802238 [Saccoglossus kowalevskii]
METTKCCESGIHYGTWFTKKWVPGRTGGTPSHIVGIIHTGIGERQFNLLLSVLNIPGIHHKSLKEREREAGTVLCNIAQESCKKIIEEETLKTKKRNLDCGHNISASYDAGWQKRGSGRTFNSSTDPANYNHSSLPYRKDLAGAELRRVLDDLFKNLAKQSQKLATYTLGSSQSNENINHVYASKAPKSKHYGGSESLKYRLSAAVSQKNIGYTYPAEANKENGLSPGIFTMSIADRFNASATKRKNRDNTKDIKKRRQHLKEIKSGKQNSQENREGQTYLSGIELQVSSPDIDFTPDPPKPPVLQQLPANVMYDVIYFDLETTSTGLNAHILQIAAGHKDKVFSQYVHIHRPIASQASAVTGHSMQTDIHIHRNAHNAIDDVEALQSLFKKCDIQIASILQHSFGINYTTTSVNISLLKKKHILSLFPLIEHKVLSRCMAERIAASGLSLNHLRLAYSREYSGVNQRLLVIAES